MKIVVVDGYTLNPGDLSWDDLGELGEVTVHERTDPEALIGRVQEADITVSNKTAFPSDVIEALPKLRFMAVTATGYDMVDIAAAGRRGIPVSNVPEYGTDSVAQFVLAMLLELCHHVGLHNEAVKAGEWASSIDWCFWKTPQVLLRNRKMGIVGFGRIGRRVGELAHALGMEVLAFDPQPGKDPAYTPFQWKGLEELFGEADVVTLHCPQTAANVGLVNRTLIQRMRPQAFLINAARGGLVVERDLAEALNSGRIAGAGVDVVSIEPIQPDNPLPGARNCIITPHIAWASLAARQNMMAQTVANIRRFLSGSPVNVVNGAYLRE